MTTDDLKDLPRRLARRGPLVAAAAAFALVALLALVIIVWALLAQQLHREHVRPHPPVWRREPRGGAS